MTMNVEKLTKMQPVTLGYLIDPKRPVLPFSMELRRARCQAEHRHPRGQLIYAGKGVMRVSCGNSLWAVPPSQALWLPSGAPHEVSFPGEVSLRSLFVDPSALDGLPSRCVALEVSPLFREMILKMASFGCDYAEGGREWRLAMAFLDELRLAKASQLELPMGLDPRLQRVTEALLESPSGKRPLGSWARLAGASSRTLARLFETETGLSFGAWRRRLLLMEALKLLGSGKSVAETSCALGYGSLSAFVAMFRREYGVTPGRFAGPGAQSAKP